MRRVTSAATPMSTTQVARCPASRPNCERSEGSDGFFGSTVGATGRGIGRSKTVVSR